MMSETTQDIFDGLRKHRDFLGDPDIRLDEFGYIIERHSHGAVHSFGWRVDQDGRVVGNMVGKSPLMG